MSVTYCFRQTHESMPQTHYYRLLTVDALDDLTLTLTASCFMVMEYDGLLSVRIRSYATQPRASQFNVVYDPGSDNGH
ncbi:hypothetical protein OUZ56_018438 [Daphnia magna]|uniref:Uncharacterized protein n=1 Tax=Daphnia magna TaxID=35525 RepID=A0ABQ9Z8W1_9CRUS|nr:hypothetical protein OUZ56_018438 [Daphnia magna]